jgi:hypothetical protein
VNASSNSTTGVGDVNFAYITTKTETTSISSDDVYYGYVTEYSNIQNDDGKKVTEVVMWTENGETTLKTKAGVTYSSGDNKVVIYKLNSDGDISSIVTEGVQSGAVSKITSNFMAIGEGDNLYFDDDVVIVTVDASEPAGVAYGCTYSDIGVAEGSKANVYYVIDSGEVVFVAYDVDNNNLNAAED